MNKFLKVTQLGQIETASNNRKYIVAKFKPVAYMPTGQAVNNNQQVVTRLLWDEFTDEKGNVFKADPLFTDVATKNLNVGDLVEGNVVRVDTTPYDLNGRTATSTTLVVFSNEDVVTVANRALANNHACVVTDDGILTKPEQTKKPELVQNP